MNHVTIGVDPHKLSATIEVVDQYETLFATGQPRRHHRSAKIKKSTAELTAIVLARGSHLMDLHGVGPVVAARVLADVGDVSRFAGRNRLASWTGTAHLDASFGEQNRHRTRPKDATPDRSTTGGSRYDVSLERAHVAAFEDTQRGREVGGGWGQSRAFSMVVATKPV
ncbi:MAG: transposase [Nocardioidaceae bacterium]